MDNLSSSSGDQRLFQGIAKIDIVIVNWNAGRQLADCLSSITQYGGDVVATVIVVDNGSSDNSLEGLDRFRLPLTVIRNVENRGFAAACNQGAAETFSEFILFLNPDARLMECSLGRPLGFMKQPQQANVGICGIRLLKENGVVARSCARFPTLATFCAEALGLSRFGPFTKISVHMRDWDHAETRTVDHVIGAFYFVRRHVFEKLNGFDERFFVYLEDLDFSYRARQAGWQSIYLADAEAFHAGGGTSRNIKATRLFYSLRSRFLYCFKHFSKLQAWGVLGATLLLEPISRTAYAVICLSGEEIKNTAKGYLMLWQNLNEILQRK